MKTLHIGDYTNKYESLFPSRFMRWWLRRPIAGLLTHWLFQGLFYMDRTERCFKLALDVLLTVLLAKQFHHKRRQSTIWLMSFLSAHTVNFLINGQLWVVLKHYGLVRNSPEHFQRQRQQLTEQVQVETSLQYAAIYGSIVRGEWRPSSDLDVRLIRFPGFVNGLRACLFVLRQRARALVTAFPLDIYILDSIKKLDLRNDESPLILLQRESD